MNGFTQFLLICLCAVLCTYGSEIKKRYEYKYSFKGPNLLLSDMRVPFWEYGGDVIAGSDFMRLTPSLRSKRGWVWCKNKTNFPSWSIEVSVRISGRGRIGADGIAIWYTAEKGQPGPIFAMNDQWNGLGVFLDSFDNDGLQNNPYVLAVNNDGTVKFDHNSDGIRQQLGGCQRDFRNKPFPVTLKVVYLKGNLEVFITNGLTATQTDYELCFQATDVHLPEYGYFGASATTGGLADDHDIIKFLTYSLTEQEAPPSTVVPDLSQDKRQEFDKEFDDYWKKMKDDEDKFKQENPEHKQDEDDVFVELQDRQLKMILAVQQHIVSQVQQLDKQLLTILSKQDLMFSQLGGHQGSRPVGAQGVPQLAAGVIERHEVEKLLNLQREFNSNFQVLRTQLDNVQQKLLSGAGSQGGHGSQGGLGSSMGEAQQNEVRDRLNTMRADLDQLLVLAKQQRSGGAGDAGCLSTWLFFVVIALQTTGFVLYSLWRVHQENRSKKLW